MNIKIGKIILTGWEPLEGGYLDGEWRRYNTQGSQLYAFVSISQSDHGRGFLSCFGVICVSYVIYILGPLTLNQVKTPKNSSILFSLE
jgi:hypothetical protein